MKFYYLDHLIILTNTLYSKLTPANCHLVTVQLIKVVNIDPLSCDGRSTWQHGNSILIKVVNIDPLRCDGRSTCQHGNSILITVVNIDPLSCDGRSTWQHGNSILIKVVNIDPLRCDGRSTHSVIVKSIRLRS